MVPNMTYVHVKMTQLHREVKLVYLKRPTCKKVIFWDFAVLGQLNNKHCLVLVVRQLNKIFGENLTKANLKLLVFKLLSRKKIFKKN